MGKTKERHWMEGGCSGKAHGGLLIHDGSVRWQTRGTKVREYRGTKIENNTRIHYVLVSTKPKNISDDSKN